MENKNRQTIIKIHSNFFGGARFFRVTEMGYIDVKIEMVNPYGEVISEFPLTWHGRTFEESIQHIEWMAHDVDGTYEVIE